MKIIKETNILDDKSEYDILNLHLLLFNISFWWSPFITSRNLDEDFTCNHGSNIPSKPLMS